MRVFGRRHSRPQLYLPPCGWQDAASVGAKGKGGFVFGVFSISTGAQRSGEISIAQNGFRSLAVKVQSHHIRKFNILLLFYSVINVILSIAGLIFLHVLISCYIAIQLNNATVFFCS